MHPKEKAKELKAKFGDLAPDVVDEVIDQIKRDTTPHEPETIDGELIGVKYWENVKEEISNQK